MPNAHPPQLDRALARRLILDELFDLTFYRRLLRHSQGSERALLEELIPMEAEHLEFWQRFFAERRERLDAGRRVKLALMLAAARVFGQRFTLLLLESIEVYGIRKYLTVWEIYRDTSLGGAVKDVLDDELNHEEAIVARFQSRQISGAKIRNLFLGLNDGLVEILGAVSGFFAAFGAPTHVFIAGLTVAVAGAFSMAAGVYVSAGSEAEVEQAQRRKRQFLGEAEDGGNGDYPLAQALVVGATYLAGAFVPLLPVFFGATSVVPSVAVAGSMIVAVSFTLAFISGMNVRERILTNVVVTAAAVVVTYGVGAAAKAIWGVGV
jgi:VIT1/CCC1 family predicted Fe2+/Mn2+ transporter